MTYRPSPKYASKDARRGAWCSCDDCGMIWNQSDMQFQYDFVGGPVPVSQGWLRCPRCITDLTYQRKLLVLPPDPAPIYNTRPENYTVDETNYWVTQDGDIFETVDGEDTYITSIPNPSEVADTAYLSTSISAPSASVAVMYLDLFDGDPASGGTSILATITGSATRTNIASSLEINGSGQPVNTAIITVASFALATANVSYAGFYDAASGGTLLMSGPVSTEFPTIVAGAVVAFNTLGIVISL